MSAIGWAALAALWILLGLAVVAVVAHNERIYTAEDNAQ